MQFLHIRLATYASICGCIYLHDTANSTPSFCNWLVLGLDFGVYSPQSSQLWQQFHLIVSSLEETESQD